MVATYWIERMELIFWNYAIYLMSCSRLVQLIVPFLYPLFQDRLRLKWVAQLAIWEITGLLIGLACGFLRGWLA